jgi:hypothetical protein
LPPLQRSTARHSTTWGSQLPLAAALECFADCWGVVNKRTHVVCIRGAPPSHIRWLDCNLVPTQLDNARTCAQWCNPP